MEQHDIFYAIAKDDQSKSPFELNNLGEKTRRRPRSTVYGGESNNNNKPIFTKVTLEDYDGLFYNEVVNMYPPSNIKLFLDHQLNYHILKEGDPIKFLEHIKYTTLHNLKTYKKEACFDITNKWIEKMEEDILLRHKNEKIAFIRRAYELASTDADGPYAATLKPHWVAKDLFNNESTVSRILHEMKNEGLIKIFASDYSSFRLMPNVANYLLDLQSSKKEDNEKGTVINNNISVNNSKDVNIANLSNHVNQQNTVTASDVAAAITDLKNNLDKFKQQVDRDFWILIEDKVDTLEAYQATESWDGNLMFQRAFRSVGSIIQAIPANIIANILTPATIELFNMLLPR